MEWGKEQSGEKSRSQLSLPNLRTLRGVEKYSLEPQYWCPRKCFAAEKEGLGFTTGGGRHDNRLI